MKSLAFVLLTLLLPLSSFSQNLKGRVVDSSKQPIPGSTVYIEETKQGLICNDNGEFQATLSPGDYHCSIICMGFETQDKKITISATSGNIFLEVVLKDKSYQLKEVLIDNSKEDPAYAIMRKAIAKAPYYQSLLKSATYEAYTKGSGKMTDIPKMFEKMGGEDMKMYKDKLFMQESFSEIKYTAPDRYDQSIKAYSSSMPNSSDPEGAMGIGMIMLYRPMFGNIVSPLNQKAFSHYRFRYEGYNEENGQIINKIKFVPKLKGPNFLEGYIYIADDDWDIRHAELVSRPTGMTIRYRFNYYPVAEGVYLVTTYEANMEASMLGMKFVADFLSSIKYTDIQLNDSLIAVEQSKKKPEKRKSLEIKWGEKYKKEVDSLAVKRDSMYWSTIRNVPLNVEELKSYIRKDTLQAYSDSLKQERLHPKFKVSDIFFGGRFGGDSSKVNFSYEGLVFGGLSEYNFVDGLWLGQSVEIGIQRNPNSWWKIRPKVYWTLSRKQMVWNVDMDFSYASMRSGKVRFSSGSVSEDYSGDKGMLRIVNSLYTLDAGINMAKLYQKDYVSIGNEIDLCNGLKWTVFGEAAKRKSLVNHASFSFWGKKEDIEPNVPDYPGDLNAQYDRLLSYGMSLQYTPEYYYWVDKGKKRYLRSRFPTMEICFQQGVPVDEGYSRYLRIEASVSQNIKIGLFDHLKYEVNAGRFLDNNHAFNFIDYKHFNTADQLITGKNPENTFTLLPYYTYSTPNQWVQAFSTYTANYLLLKRIPFLQGKFFTESLHARYLYTPEKRHYSEWGYSVGLPAMGNDIPSLGRIGVFVSFDSFLYNSWGISIAFPFLQMRKNVKNAIK